MSFMPDVNTVAKHVYVCLLFLTPRLLASTAKRQSKMVRRQTGGGAIEGECISSLSQPYNRTTITWDISFTNYYTYSTWKKHWVSSAGKRSFKCHYHSYVSYSRCITPLSSCMLLCFPYQSSSPIPSLSLFYNIYAVLTTTQGQVPPSLLNLLLSMMLVLQLFSPLILLPEDLFHFYTTLHSIEWLLRMMHRYRLLQRVGSGLWTYIQRAL